MILDNLEEIYDIILEELTYRVGIVDFKNPSHIFILGEIISDTKLSPYKDICIEAICEANNVTVQNVKTGNVYDVSNDTAKSNPGKYKKPSAAAIKKAKGDDVSKEKAADEKLSTTQIDDLKAIFSQKSETTQGLTSSEYKKLPNGTLVRQLVDESGNVIDVSTDSGRKQASKLLDERIKKFDDKTKLAIKTFNSGVNVIQKWLGEVGELQTLKQSLDAGVEAYLLTDSERKNDIAFVKPNGEKGELFIGYVSVKTTKGDGGVNKRGANCKADLDKLSHNGDDEYETKVNGKAVKLKSTNVIGSIIDVKSAFFNKYTCEEVRINGKKQKLTEYTKEKYPNTKETDIVKADNGKLYFKSQSTFLRNQTLTEKEINDLLDNPANDKFFTNLQKPSKGNPNQIADKGELANTKEFIKSTLLNDVRKGGGKYTLYDLHNTMAYVIGDSVLRSNIEITATGDTAAIHYTEGNPVPKIGVIRKQDANVAIQTANENNQQIKDYRERCIDLSKNVLGLNSRTRAVGSNKHYDGIDNLEPIGKTIPKETELNTFLKQ
jgi:hypothetical protein